MTKIRLTRGQTAIIDDADYDIVSKHEWYALPAVRALGGFYAATSVRGRTVYMHRLLMAEPCALTVDHINGDKLDNRRSNLRTATRLEQARNSKAKGGRSCFKGVSLHESGLWRAELGLPNRKRIVKYASTETDAARLYNALAREHYGAFAKINEVAA